MQLDPNKFDSWQAWVNEGYTKYDKDEGDKRQRLCDYWMRINRIKQGKA